jgi:hypothetical protein
MTLTQSGSIHLEASQRLTPEILNREGQSIWYESGWVDHHY